MYRHLKLNCLWSRNHKRKLQASSQKRTEHPRKDLFSNNKKKIEENSDSENNLKKTLSTGMKIEDSEDEDQENPPNTHS